MPRRDQCIPSPIGSASPVDTTTDVEALTVGVDSADVVAPSLGELLTITGGEREVCNDLGGGDEIGEASGVVVPGAGSLGVTLMIVGGDGVVGGGGETDDASGVVCWRTENSSESCVGATLFGLKVGEGGVLGGATGVEGDSGEATGGGGVSDGGGTTSGGELSGGGELAGGGGGGVSDGGGLGDGSGALDGGGGGGGGELGGGVAETSGTAVGLGAAAVAQAGESVLKHPAT